MNSSTENQDDAAVSLLASTSQLLQTLESQAVEEIDEIIGARQKSLSLLEELTKNTENQTIETSQKLLTLLKESEVKGSQAKKILEDRKKHLEKLLRSANQSKEHLLKTHMVTARGHRLDAKG